MKVWIACTVFNMGEGDEVNPVGVFDTEEAATAAANHAINAEAEYYGVDDEDMKNCFRVGVKEFQLNKSIWEV
ncbi:MAG: hypothetical protein EBR82_75945 [Caulobacteraceae bacterium]|nr:hypothetical protein [Caulobacteraceae bacterium]